MKPIVPVFLIALVAVFGGAVYFVNGRALTYEALDSPASLAPHPAPSAPLEPGPAVSSDPSSLASPMRPPVSYMSSQPLAGCVLSDRGCRCIDAQGFSVGGVSHDQCVAIATGQ